MGLDMSPVDSANPLASATRVAVLGDLHGDLAHLTVCAATAWKRGVDVLLQTGDFGFAWGTDNYQKDLDKISRRLRNRGQTLYWVDGNHDDFNILYEKFPLDPDGLRRLRPNILHAPRGYRTVLSSGKVLAVLGGANSIDRTLRTEGVDWWPEESITEGDLAALGADHADILIGHEAPLHVPDLDRELEANPRGWRPSAHEYAAESRRMFHRGFMAVRPQLSLSGHYHTHLDQDLSFGGGEDAFRCRVVILDKNEPKAKSQAILDVASMHLEYFTRDDAKVVRLDVRDRGKWIVRTHDAVHAFDLDNRTVERRPNPGARPSPTIDQPLPLLDIRMLHVGGVGIWTLDPLEERHSPYWDHFSPPIEHIERVAEL
jgi:predicted phosphodiesterase